MATNEEKFTKSLVLNKLFLNNDEDISFNDHLMDTINVFNVAIFYKLAGIYSLANLTEGCFSFIQRCFTMVATTTNFLELGYNYVMKILSSSEVNVTSELEVFNVVENWVNYDKKERKQHFYNLLKNCVSYETLKRVLSKNSCYNSESLSVVEEVLTEKTQLNRGVLSSINLNRRFCSQDLFQILFCGGSSPTAKFITNLRQTDGSTLKSKKVVTSLDKKRQLSKMVNIQSNVYIFGGLTERAYSIKTIEKYSLITNKHEIVANMFDDRMYYFCTCALMDKIYIIGGSNVDSMALDSCLEFDTNTFQFKEVANMKMARNYAACTVFEGKVVVSGGYTDNSDTLNSVEIYDHLDDTWTYMPSMIENRMGHKSVGGRRKIFVIGGQMTSTCEVFDASSNTFVALKISLSLDETNLDEPVDIILNGNQMIVFTHMPTKVICYNLSTGEWREDKCEAIEDLENFCCVKVPQF